MILKVVLSLIFVISQASATEINKKDIYEDLNYFKKIIEERFSYYQISKQKVSLTLDKLKVKIKKNDSYSKVDLMIDLQRIISNYIDGHADVRGWRSFEKGYLPFIIEMTKIDKQWNYFAIRSDRTDYFLSNYPYLKKINDIEIREYIEKLKEFSPKGTEHFVIRNILHILRDFSSLFYVMNGKKWDSSFVVLEFSNGREIKKIKTKLVKKWPFYGSWPRTQSKIIKNNIGYLRIEEMFHKEKKLRNLHKNMKSFKDTEGLIIDLRGNTGGSREILLELLPYFMPDNEKIMVGTVGLCRLFQGCELGSRYMYPISSRQYNRRERDFLYHFASQFKPRNIEFDSSLFSDWHYLLIRNRRNPQYFYDKKVIVLMNKDNFSAADILLGALKSRKNMVFIGESSSGGSAARKSYRLPNSNIKLSLARMLSFQPSGELYDGVGINPDIIKYHEPGFYLGISDQVLEYARQSLIK